MGEINKIKAYYESKIEELSSIKPKLSNKDIEELAEDIANEISIDDGWKDRYDIAFNLIHKKYGI